MPTPIYGPFITEVMGRDRTDRELGRVRESLVEALPGESSDIQGRIDQAERRIAEIDAMEGRSQTRRNEGRRTRRLSPRLQAERERLRRDVDRFNYGQSQEPLDRRARYRENANARRRATAAANRANATQAAGQTEEAAGGTGRRAPRTSGQ